MDINCTVEVNGEIINKTSLNENYDKFEMDDANKEEISDIFGKMAKFLTHKPRCLPPPEIEKKRRRARQRKSPRKLAEDYDKFILGCQGVTERNWTKVSTDPFMNFLRSFKKLVPKDCPVTVMKQKGRIIWRKMSKDRKQPYFEQAKRAKDKGLQVLK